MLPNNDAVSDRQRRRGRGAAWQSAACCACLSVLATIGAAPTVADEPTIRDVAYATIGQQRLLLDLYQPAESPEVSAPLIVWVHGGAWRSGSRGSVPIAPLTAEGFAIASIDYRLTPVAPFPAQVHDIKAAIRFLRQHAEEYRLDPDRVVIAGASAGGHLAALVGVSDGHPRLEGHVGEATGASRVQAIVSFYGASNLQTILAQSTPHGLGVRIPALQLLLGGQPDEKPDVARLASPVAHVDADDPPLLMLHGDQDLQMPVNQSLELLGAYQQSGARVWHLHVVHGGGHGGEVFYDEDRLGVVIDFLREQLAADTPEAARTNDQ